MIPLLKLCCHALLKETRKKVVKLDNPLRAPSRATRILVGLRGTLQHQVSRQAMLEKENFTVVKPEQPTLGPGFVNLVHC
ncbi:hypothetical protein Y1Q_0022901 [Alligator mississippiensis]|uniref:Uncharacterized protein n=1 Tax=Alligator mississippiensis TaxID=8496 RepID=A0A151N4X3_ALLMI|nr:hypothetical protein Y1Q_0022901 [Alligator mississippiensis]